MSTSLSIEKFFIELKKTKLFKSIKDSQVEGICLLWNEWLLTKIDNLNQFAYLLASVCHESDKTMQAIEEYGKGKGKRYAKRVKYNGTPYTDTMNIFYGRGHIQLTWYDNYLKCSKVAGVDLIKYPEKMLDAKISAKVTVFGMVTGVYTGAKLSTYFNSKGNDAYNARKIVNLLDKADLIKGYYEQFLHVLELSID